MANNFNLTLDTTAPASLIITLEGGAAYATEQLINSSISTGDGNTTGYQMKLWGNVDTTYDASVQATEGASSWITYASSKQLKLSSGDGSKTIFIKIRDDVYNVSAQASDLITLDTTLPIVTVVGGDVPKISKQTGKNICSFSFTSDTDYLEYKVKVVASTGSTHDTGTVIGSASGSVNMSSSGIFTGAIPVNCQINGADLELASSGDGTKIIKVFVREASGSWSV